MRNILFLSCVVLAFSTVALAQVPSTEKKAQQTGDRLISPFRYIIVGDVTSLQKAMNDSSSLRNVEVLMEDSAFTESNLIKLAELLGRRFSDRPALSAEIFTTLDAIRTPEEYDQTDLGGLREDYRNYKYALFRRDGNGARLIYEIPGVRPRKEIRLNLPTEPIK